MLVQMNLMKILEQRRTETIAEELIAEELTNN